MLQTFLAHERRNGAVLLDADLQWGWPQHPPSTKPSNAQASALLQSCCRRLLLRASTPIDDSFVLLPIEQPGSEEWEVVQAD